MNSGYSDKTTTSARFRRGAFAAVLAVTMSLLVGCGGAGHSQAIAHKTMSAPAGLGTVAEVPARAACEHAVRIAPRLQSSAKSEIAGLCRRINSVVEDNEKTVRSICQEAANASSLTGEFAKQRTATTCYSDGMHLRNH